MNKIDIDKTKIEILRLRVEVLEDIILEKNIVTVEEMETIFKKKAGMTKMLRMEEQNDS